MEFINTHCHSKYCGHGEGEIAEYVDAAQKAYLTTLAFTEHYPLTKAFDPDEYLSVLPENMPLYIERVLEAREQAPEMDILLGIELDYLGTDEDRTFASDEFDQFDLVLGSVHFVDAWPFDDPAQRDVWEQEGQVEHIWERYVDLWCTAASDRTLRFDVMSHPDLAKKFGYYPDFPLEPLYARMAEAAHEGGRMIELNTSGAYYACAEAFPAPALLRAFAHAEVPCTVGTDAHVPKNVARDIEQAYATLYEAGYRHITVPTFGREVRHIEL